jgi:hypothetical protein
MSAIASPLPRASHSKALAAILVLALVALAGVGINGLVSGTHRLSVPLYTAPAKAFRIALPKGWHALSPTQLRALKAAPTAVLRRADGSATVVMRPAPALHGTPAQVLRALGSQLRTRFHSFKPVSARVARLRGGAAIVYTFVRDPNGTVQTLVLAPARGRLWELDAVMPGGRPAVARQVGAMLATFGS